MTIHLRSIQKTELSCYAGNSEAYTEHVKRALITGSETFGKYLTSPSKWLALFADGKVVADHQVHSLIFPSIVFTPSGMEDPGEKIIRVAKEIRADVIISFGLASEAKGFRLEQSGINQVYV